MELDELFAGDLILPSQWLRSPRLCPCGSHRLMLEILADAFLTLVRLPPGYPRGHRSALWEVTAWFQQPYRPAPVNLSDCCDALNLDVGQVQAVGLSLARRASRTCAPHIVQTRENKTPIAIDDRDFHSGSRAAKPPPNLAAVTPRARRRQGEVTPPSATPAPRRQDADNPDSILAGENANPLQKFPAKTFLRRTLYDVRWATSLPLLPARMIIVVLINTFCY